MGVRFLGALLFCLLLPLSVLADDKPSAGGQLTAHEEDRHPAASVPAAAGEARLPAHVETHHVLQLGDKSLAYTATAETIPLTDGKGETTAAIFTTSYLADRAAAARPVAFVFNGGPGAASVFLHLGALGPQIVETPGNGAPPMAPVKLIDNPNSWLGFTDLVFVDPVGTGFSRGKGKDENPDKPFWNVRSDLNSLSQLARLWLTRHDRWASPVYLVGESYGGFRAAALSKTLADDVGIAVSGVVMVSPALDTRILHPDVSNLMVSAFELPSYAAVAAALGGQARADHATAERFALTDYLTGLSQLPNEPDAKDPFLARVAALTGLPEDTVQRERGRVSSDAFARELRKGQHQILSFYDATVTRPTTGNPWDDHAGDLILDGATAAYTAAFDIYAPEALGYRTDLQYWALHHETAQQWNWEAADHGHGGLGLALASLQSALLAHPQMKVLIANGRYDLVTPYFASRWLVDQLSLPDSVRKQIAPRVYEGGHMMYMRPASRAALAADAAALFAGRDAAAAE